MNYYPEVMKSKVTKKKEKKEKILDINIIIDILFLMNVVKLENHRIMLFSGYIKLTISLTKKSPAYHAEVMVVGYGQLWTGLEFE